MTTTASTTDEREALLPQIRPNGMDYANAWTFASYREQVTELDATRLRYAVQCVKEWRRARGRDTTTDVCWQGGGDVPANGAECRPCDEGIRPIS